MMRTPEVLSIETKSRVGVSIADNLRFANLPCKGSLPEWKMLRRSGGCMGDVSVHCFPLLPSFPSCSWFEICYSS